MRERTAGGRRGSRRTGGTGGGPWRWASCRARRVRGRGGACSATMLVSAEEWEALIWRAGEETRRRDYRATEAKIEHRLYMSRWFNEWARQFRPGTHYSSVGYGLTWQRVHVAHAFKPRLQPR